MYTYDLTKKRRRPTGGDNSTLITGLTSDEKKNHFFPDMQSRTAMTQQGDKGRPGRRIEALGVVSKGGRNIGFVKPNTKRAQSQADATQI